MYSEMISGVFGVLVGAIIGNRLAIGRERRKEYNEVADVLHDKINLFLLIAESGKFPDQLNEFGEEDFIALRKHISKYQSSKLSLAIHNYENVKVNCGDFDNGIYKFKSPNLLIEALENLQKFVRHR